MKKRILSLIAAFAVVLTAFQVSASADTPAVTVKNAAATAGGYAYVYIDASGFTNVAGLEFNIYYDSSAISVSSHSNGYLLSSSNVSVNTAVSGTLALSAVSVEGISTSGQDSYYNRLLTVCFKLNYDCKTGQYPINIAVGEVYDGDLSPVNVSGVSGVITVSAAATETFNLYGSASSSPLHEGDEWTLTVNHNTSQTFSGADFSVEYDRELFGVEAVELSSGLKTEGAVYSVNTSVEGLVKISYAAVAPVSSYSLFTVRLKVIKDTDETAEVTVAVSEAYNDELKAYAPNKFTRMLTLKKRAVPVNYPDLWLETETFKLGQTALSTLWLEVGAGVAAADFTLSYDPSVLICKEVKAADGISSVGGMIVINPNFNSGTVKFSYVNEKGYSDSNIALVTLLWEPVCSPSEHFKITLGGTDVVDVKSSEVKLEYITETDCIYSARVTPPTCTEQGFTEYFCSCGESYTADYTNPMGHTDSDNDIVCDLCGEVMYQKVDINGDSSVNILDLVSLKKCIANISESKGASPDIDGDGTIGSKDLAILKRFLLR